MCYRIKPEACPVGNPIQCAGGQKMQREVDMAGSGPSSLAFVRYYSSTGFYASAGVEHPREVLGTHWRHSWQSSIAVEPAQGAGQDTYAYVVQPNGDYRHFRLVGSSWVGRADKSETLQEIIAGDVRTGWLYQSGDDSVHEYDADGRWLAAERDGQVTSLIYSDESTPSGIAPKPGLLIRVTDVRGRSLDLRYDADAYLVEVIDASGATFGYRYVMHHNLDLPPRNTGVLQFADRPGGTTREYVYNEPEHVHSSALHLTLLSGIVDENGNRFGTYRYDASGRAYEEFQGSGANALGLTYSGTYLTPTSSTITVDALGQIERRRFVAVAGVIRDAGRDRCSDSTCTAITHSTQITYTADGNRDLVADFRGIVTDYDYDTRGLETQRIEAKAIPGGATPPEKRTIQTDWHVTFRVPIERRTLNASGVLESRSQWAYNARGQATARCEVDPADPAAMAYTCSATVAPPAGAKVRRTVTTWCEAADVTAGTCPLEGLPVAVNGPRSSSDPGMSSLDDITTYTYRLADDPTCATAGACTYRTGDLWKVTNALGHVSETVAYDGNGRPTRVRDTNGTVTDFAYHPRGWLVDRIVRALGSGTPSQGDATTHLDYDAVGNVTRVTQADGSFLAYTYDAAHRLLKVTDNLNNAIDYCPGGVGTADCLDAAGHRRIEQVKDPSGTIRRSLRRTHNQLGQLTALLNAQGQPTLSHPPATGYDANGNATHALDGLGVETRREYDPLNRLKTAIQDALGPDPATADTTTGYAYDARDRLREVTDPDGLTTLYDYDGLDNLTALHSPDTGDTSYTHDRAGNRISQTDARGVTSTYTYDALNRLTHIAYPTASLNVTFQYDQPNPTTGCGPSFPTGRLTRILDASGSTTYCYDRRGNVTQKTQVTGVETRTVSYTWTKADRLASITYPSGGIATYDRNAIGQVTGITWKATLAAPPVSLIGNATYYPFGPLHVLTYGNGRTLTRTYDQDYAIDSVASSDPNGLVLDLTTDVMGNIIQARDTLGAPTPTRTYTYDRLYRLTGVQDSTSALQEGFTYTKTGDRTSKALAGQAPQVYSYLANSHRLGDIDGAARDYDASGNLTLDEMTYVGFAYDDRNRLVMSDVSPTTGSYEYNGKGERVLRRVETQNFNAWEYLTVYGESGQRLSETRRGVCGSTGMGAFAGPGPCTPGPTTHTEWIYVDDMPVAQITDGAISYLETDHLGTPRLAADPATNAWQWKWDFFGSAFGEHDPIMSETGGIMVNLRYPGQQYDAETGLHYNYFRDYEPSTGRYIESDPIGLRGGLSTYAYALSNPILIVDPTGLFTSSTHNEITREAMILAPIACPELPQDVALADWLPGSQAPENSAWHAMRDGTNKNATRESAQKDFNDFVDQQWKICTCASLARALHAMQDSYARGHSGFQSWSGGLPGPSHVYRDAYPSKSERDGAVNASADLIRKYNEGCNNQCPQ